MKHELKTLSEYFQAVKAGAKTFEIRQNDRGFKVGDTLLLREWIPCVECNGTRRVWPEGKRGASEHCEGCDGMEHAGIYTGETVKKSVSYMTDYAQQKGHVVMALQPTP